jgi:tungstate transport system substrate-binding protein
MLKRYLMIFIMIIASPLSVHALEVLIQSTTSTRDSGFYEFILPKYPNFDSTNIKVVAVGTGQAIKNAENCDADILIVHDHQKEMNFMKNKYGIKRNDLMYNDYVLIGPSHDPANIGGSSGITSSFQKIADGKHSFISRSDSSGTHSFELSIWNKANINPVNYSGDWYLETGQGMGQSLNVAIATQSYILSDRSTWENFRNKQNHIVLYENSNELANKYGIILINPDYCRGMSYESALLLYNWLISDDAKNIIKSFTINNKPIFNVP